MKSRRPATREIFTGTRVEVKHNKIELALRKFKNKVKDANIMLELRKRQHYVKPSNKRREQRNLTTLRHKHRVEKEKKIY